MPVALTFLLLLVWLVISYRAFQRGDMLMAVLALVVGAALTTYRLRAAKKASKPASTAK